MVTVGDLFEKPKVELFLGCDNSDFYTRCRTREKEIKKTFRMTFEAFNVHIRILDERRSELTKWEEERIKECVTNLGDYLQHLVKELDRKKIERHCKKITNEDLAFLPDLVLIMINSYHGAIKTDIHWVSDLLLYDSIDISNGEFDFNKLRKYLPEKIDSVKNLYNELTPIDYVASYHELYNEAIGCFNLNFEKAYNLLLITIIEGLVRALGKYLGEKQKLNIDTSNKRKYASLERFLKKIPWKKDLQIEVIKYGFITGKYTLYKDIKQDNLLINLTERLGFLSRRFKENRNVILHGEETNYASTLNSFLNISALQEVLLTIKEYKEVY